MYNIFPVRNFEINSITETLLISALDDCYILLTRLYATRSLYCIINITLENGINIQLYTINFIIELVYVVIYMLIGPH